VVPVAFDSTDPAGAARIRAAVDALGRLDALVNNAAHIFDDELPEEEAVRRSFETNTLGPLRLTRALAEALRADGGANVVNVSTGMAGLAEMGPGHTGYRLSKVALNGLTRVLHHELGPQVRVNAVCPGWVRTRMGGPRATRTVEAGARGITWAATLGPGGPSGGFFRDGQPIPW
jgi:NAD(P)-dependent dehydrogenase (short-subunit alcohol dehydrogenase family)